ncbi:nicotinate-nucleotide pyrophosphorylase [carboxylating] [Motilibacter rhizosphaerae]|uniref:Nicotinate-nucleotide pyrophosphorylase [carboxylating] n=1 Tax=Motilibacter rhizosphaerae TaxID=598652 RepID=A0A4Q7NAD8_9ACTN|nr:carboxylating nicotinate-nucleotide diphosphorylase [Motilibacter rhizosphaerae]RZS79454.1 nicotinate-nucleotide pyrophosphorylase [carboxylating] [Motilibacter rhizosphaerae]
MTLRPQTRQALADAGLDPDAVVDLVTRALEEDLAGGVDATTLATVPAGSLSSGDLVSRADGIVAGVPVAAAVFEVAGDAVLEPVARDGSLVRRGTPLATVAGPTRVLLTAERTALNLIGRLSGIATLTAIWVDEVAGTGAAVRDTRKTTPGLRALEKYAVRCGGGVNHRMSLSDAAMVKDNHVVAAGGVVAAFEAVRRAYPDLPVEVEADTVDDAVLAVEAGADLVLLDNMGPEDLRRAVALVEGRARLEASGGLSLANAREVASTGVDYLAVGALTHSAQVLDIGLDLHPLSRDTAEED